MSLRGRSPKQSSLVQIIQIWLGEEIASAEVRRLAMTLNNPAFGQTAQVS